MVYCSAMKDYKILKSDEWKGRVCMIKIYLKVVEINSFFDTGVNIFHQKYSYIERSIRVRSDHERHRSTLNRMHTYISFDFARIRRKLRYKQRVLETLHPIKLVLIKI